ncbi:MAG: dehydrogenase [Acidobacteria bacterium]|nr:MAG: dehydrogenase [Acidobacteriota bacterium]
MRKIKTAVLGTGFMGRVHTEGIRRVGNVEVAAIAASSQEKARKFADELGVERSTGDYRTLLKDPEINAVHVCTPNALHFPMAKAALEAGKHVLCEKPLATSVEEAQQMVDLARAKNLANCTFHNLRYYPMVQHIRRMREAGELGDIYCVQGTYSQDWLLYDTDWNWRIDSSANGRSRAFADIGTHWCDMIEHVTGLRITSVCADLQTFHKTRKRPKGSIETFAGKMSKPEDYDVVPIDTEDYAAVLLRLGDRTRGAFTVSQVSAGRKNRLAIEIYGTKGSAAWDQEKPDELWLGQRNSPNQVIVKDPSLLHEKARSYADLPGGHSEGYDDTFKQVFRRFYRTVADRSAAVEYAQFVDGLRQLQILDKVLESSSKHAWADVPAPKLEPKSEQKAAR